VVLFILVLRAWSIILKVQVLYGGWYLLTISQKQRAVCKAESEELVPGIGKTWGKVPNRGTRNTSGISNRVL